MTGRAKLMSWSGGAASGTFLAIPVLSGKRAGQLGSGGWLGVLPNSASGGVGVEPEQLEQALLGGVGVGEDALGAGSAFVPGGGEQDGFFDATQGREQLTDAEVQAAVVGLSAHQVCDGQGEHAVEDVDPDLGLGPVEHGGEPDDVGVFELAEPGLDVVLGAVAGDDFGDGPVVVVGDEQALAEDLGFQCLAGGGVDLPAQPHLGRCLAGQVGGQHSVDPAGAGDRGDVGQDGGAVAAGLAAGQGVGQLAQAPEGLGQGLVEAAGLCGCLLYTSPSPRDGL